MKIRTMEKSYREVMALPRPEHKKPGKPSFLLGTLVRLLSTIELRQVGFTGDYKNMEKAGDGPWLVLMNHSSFLDLEIASAMLWPKTYNIVCTGDGLVGKEGIMRGLGCISTQKFVTDIRLITDLKHALQVNKTSVLMYPEASYSFDGTTTKLPRRLGILLKALKVPVVMITTYGSFTRDPLYNNLQKRKVKVSATIECLASPEEIREKSVEELDEILDRAFDLDYFRWQEETGTEINDEFRADELNRILYKCPACLTEGEMEGKGTLLTCHHCGKTYEMTPLGKMRVHDSEEPAEFPHVPDWYAWEREQVKKEIEEGTYHLDTKVKIGCIVDFKALYMVGEGTLHHDANGFVLDGCGGELHYEQGPLACYSLYSDYYWYEIGDMICIGDKDCLYYCFPEAKDVAAKTRIAVEELFRRNRKR